MKKASRFYKLPSEIAARKDLRPSAKIVFSVISNRVGKNGQCWPSIRRLADETGLHFTTIFRDIEQLEKVKILTVERNKNSRKNNRYKVEDIVCKIHTDAICKKHTDTNNHCMQNDNSTVCKKHTPLYAKCDTNKNKRKEKELKEKVKARALAELLINLITEHKPDFREGRPDRREKTLKRWTKEIDLMIRKDGRTPERIEAVMRWATSDVRFWQSNILSAASLRKHYDRLELEPRRANEQKTPEKTISEQIRDHENELEAIRNLV